MTGPVGKVQHSGQALPAKQTSNEYVMTKRGEFAIPLPMKTSDILLENISECEKYFDTEFNKLKQQDRLLTEELLLNKTSSKPIKTKGPQYEGSVSDTTYDARMQKMFGGKAHIL